MSNAIVNQPANLNETERIFRESVLNDYRIAVESREVSLTGRKEVLTGKAKFGIFGDGKELAQLAMARVFQNGDFRSGYYRDQTFMFATGNLTIEAWFAQLYSHTDVDAEPSSGGRQMNGHYATRSLNADGSWKNLMAIKNSSADISPTAGQMLRLVGLALASKHYRHNTALHTSKFATFSNKGNEIAFGTIGDASTSEGHFWEAVNAAGVQQIPMLVSVWDDGYGISVPKKYQTSKESISEALSGFQRTANKPGYEILKTKGWDYPHLVETYEKAANICREQHVPVLVHVEEVAQPQGHSTSGSHERYKSKERLQWEADFDCIRKFREWLLASTITTVDELDQLEKQAKENVRNARRKAWEDFNAPILSERNQAIQLLDALAATSRNASFITKLRSSLAEKTDPIRRDTLIAARSALRYVRHEHSDARQQLIAWLNKQTELNYTRYSSSVYSNSRQAITAIPAVPVNYAEQEVFRDGREILRDNFDAILSKYPEVCIFGEDAGNIGGVNQSLEKLQEKYGKLRVFDTGIREATILGQAIGMAMRGLRPIAEIQYLDYLLYALQAMSDDLATLQWRTMGGQKAPVIISTRGHRLEGVWHSGSPMGMIIHAVRGIHVCVPRNMTQAAGFYNTLLRSDEPGLVIEPLNSYRLKELTPQNWGEFCIPLGQPEILREGTDLTIVSYGPTLRLVLDAAQQLQEMDISVEVIDVQTLLPFDTDHRIVQSLKKTNRLLVVDEDVPGGASSFILQHILEKQNGFQYLDSAPRTLTGKEHRPAYGSDGDYFSKPGADDVFEMVYAIMRESNPVKWPDLY
jgi:pyruvate/2-oxoglutarate/acetoin dehydrogenase E1 component/TPP-dependent pyruvate/acetoin dehydrogenase alpha subunit